jgi:hypothetical protein
VNLREKLLRLAGPAPPLPHPPPRAGEWESHAPAGEEKGHPVAPPPPGGRATESGGTEKQDEIVGPPGATFLLRRVGFPLAHAHGAFTLAEVAATATGEIAAMGDAAPRSDAAHPAPLFFDIETTSLGSGAGVYAFIVGFLWREGDRFVAEQLYLREVAGEREMLLAAAERIGAAPLLVSFAGRGFDERRLEDRFRFLGLPSPFARGGHADLCPIARALWRSRLGSCTLGAVERARLGVTRAADLPGAECPAAYFRALRGDAEAREDVLRHNLSDLLSLATLAAALARRRAGARDAAEHLGFGRHERRRGREAAALAALEAAAREVTALTPAEQIELRLELAALLRRAGRGDEAAAHLRAIVDGPGEPPIGALIDLAKHAEHRARDLPLAERCTVAAISQLRRRAVDCTAEQRAALLGELSRRLARVQEKARRAGPSWFGAG